MEGVGGGNPLPNLVQEVNFLVSADMRVYVHASTVPCPQAKHQIQRSFTVNHNSVWFNLHRQRRALP